MKTEFPVTTTMTNDFILKTMDYGAANVDLKDFNYGMLMAMFERVVLDDKID